ncbi:hypothetical protein GGU45_004269 [Niabella hirudinis]
MKKGFVLPDYFVFAQYKYTNLPRDLYPVAAWFLLKQG